MSDDKPPVPVFISYSHADRKRVEPLAQALEARGLAVWWDKQIEGGSVFARTIEENLDAAAAVIVVWSQSSVASDWVRDEAGHGRDRKRLVPISLDGTQPPLGFKQYHSIAFGGWRGQADAPQIDELLRGIASAAGAEIPLPRSQPQGSNGIFNRRTALMLAGGAAAATAGGALWWSGILGKGEPGNSIAVMPFKNLSGDPAQAYFSDGLSEEIRTTLSRNSALQIAAPTSVAQFRNQPGEPRQIGDKLGVAYLLEGSVRRSGNAARISAELIEAKSGFSRWTQTFDRNIADIFAVQTEIANVVANALVLRVAPIKVSQGGTHNVEAYEAYLRGRAQFRSDKGEASDREALSQYAQALQLDPDFALARAHSAYVMTSLANIYATPDESRRLYARALDDAQKATTQAPEAAEAHLALGFTTLYAKRDFKAARSALEKANSLGGGDTIIAVTYALVSTYMGAFEKAAAAAERATTLDPLNASTFRLTGLIQYYAHKFDAARSYFAKALALKADLRNVHGYQGNMLLLQGDLAAARTEFALEKQDMIRLPGMAIIERKQGQAALADKVIGELIAKVGDNSAFQQAQIYAQWGEVDKAFAALDKALAINDSGLLIAKVDPLLEPLRADTRYSRLLNAIGFG